MTLRFVTSGILDSSTLPVEGATNPQQVMPTSNKSVFRWVHIQNDANQPLNVYINAGGIAPVIADDPSWVVLAGQTLIVPCGDVGRLISPSIYVTVQAAATGSVVINAIA